MITVEKLKDKLQKEFGWENLDSNEYKWFIDNLLRDSIKAINFTGSSMELKNKQVLSFDDWVDLNNYTQIKDAVYKDENNKEFEETFLQIEYFNRDL